MAKLHPLLQPYVPSSDDPFDATKAAHLLNRAGFGGTSEEIERVMSLGPRRAVDELMDFPDAGAEEQSLTDVPDLSSIDGIPATFRQYRLMQKATSAEELKQLRQKFMAANREALIATIGWWMNRMAYGPRPLQEKLTLFWHGHFTTSAKDERAAALMWDQNELLRRHAAGNFREFVRQISRDPAMLDYLNNTQNKKAHPNENYARELMELFTLGIGHYSENDIRESARAFTGWSHDGDAFRFNNYDHDANPKTFMGRRGNFDGDDIIDIILLHPACAPYVASRLWTFFAYEDPEPLLCQSMGQLIRENRFELRPVLRAMFASRGFYSQRAIGTQIKSPVQLIVGMVKQLGLKMPRPGAVYSSLQQMGQVPMMPPNVKGWAGGRSWINTSTLFVRYNACVNLVAGARTKSDGGSVESAVDGWVSRLIQRPIDAEKRKVLIDSIAGKPDNADRTKKLIQLIVSMPEYQLC